MVDLKEPVRRVYSDEEGREVTKSFLLLLFYFLAFYLSLHNLIIPLGLNIFRGNEILQDVHYWFILALPLGYLVKNDKPIPRSYVLFLIFGSLSRLIIYNTILYTKSWTIASVYLTEISLLIYCLLIYQKSQKDKFLLLSLSGFLAPLLLTQLEFHSVDKAITFPITNKRTDFVNEGCLGSQVFLDFPQSKLPAQHVLIKSCGFEHNTVVFNDTFTIKNSLNHQLHLRLYKLSHREGKMYWKFVRLLKVDESSSIALESHLKPDAIYLLKAPERRNIGILVLVPVETTLTGKFTFTPDSIRKDSP